MKYFGVDDPDLSARVAHFYITQLPYKNYFYPYVEEILKYLLPRYKLHVITNGFEEVQKVKISHSFLRDYIDTLITSEDAGYKKPDQRIFHYAFTETGALPDESLMVGDDPEVDIEGARQAGMDQVLFNPSGMPHNTAPTWEISSLVELKAIL
jgi:putative hydrolase of the HAD superfamily